MGWTASGRHGMDSIAWPWPSLAKHVMGAGLRSAGHCGCCGCRVHSKWYNSRHGGGKVCSSCLVIASLGVSTEVMAARAACVRTRGQGGRGKWRRGGGEGSRVSGIILLHSCDGECDVTRTWTLAWFRPGRTGGKRVGRIAARRGAAQDAGCPMQVQL